MRTARPLAERLAELTFPEPNSGCFLWCGVRTRDGYGLIRVVGRRSKTLVHRAAYELEHGEIPDGLTLDHLCRNRACLNPRHLEAVPMRTNVLRGQGPTALNAAKTACVQGHAYDSENTRWGGSEGMRYRICRACKIAANRDWRARRTAARSGSRPTLTNERTPSTG